MTYTTPMPLSQNGCVDAISEHSAGFAAAVRAAPDGLATDLEWLPGWDLSTLVQHLIQVHLTWMTIVRDRLWDRPDEAQRPVFTDSDDLVARFEAGATRLTQVLAAADPRDRVWTWAPTRQDAGFVIRHQVQEIVVHHWDAAHAAGLFLTVDPLVGADSVDEFLHFSVSSADDHEDPPPPALDGTFELRCTDSSYAWRLTDGDLPGTVRVERLDPATADDPDTCLPVVSATGGDLLLWLYGRIPLDTAAVDAVDPDLIERFRALTDTA